MRRIREILLNEYIGAITIGFIFAQAVIQFINAMMQIGTHYWITRQANSFARSAPFPWENFIVSIISVALNLFAGFLLLQWLYAPPQPGPGDEADDAGKEVSEVTGEEK